MRKQSKQILPTLSPEEMIDKRMSQINIEIDSSKTKIDQYINLINSKIAQTINNKLNKIVSIHQKVVDQKDQQIKVLSQDTDKYKQTYLNENVTKLKTLNEYQQNLQRISTILEIFKKESEKYKIELDIKEKQLEACKKRQKQLIKQVWSLQQNIKDIYSYQFIQSNQPQAIQTQRQRRNRTNISQMVKSQHNTSKTARPESVSRQQRTQFNPLIQDRPCTPKPSIYDMTKLSQKLNFAYNSRYIFDKSFHISSDIKDPSNKDQQLHQQRTFNKISNFNMYDDLRDSMRKMNRIQTQSPKYFQEKDSLIGIEEFRLIAVNGPKIMKQISKISIKKHGFLQQIDQQSINILNQLFQNENSVKILEIMLFNYSMQALRQIKQHKDIIISENYYSQPSKQANHHQKPIKLHRPNKHKIDMVIRKNFKPNFTKLKTHQQ